MKLKALCCMLIFSLFLGHLNGCSQKDPMETAMEQIESTAESIGEQIKEGISTGKDQIESMLTSALGGESMDTVQEDRSMIGKEEAQRIALEYVGLPSSEVRGLHTEYEIDDGVPKYDITFYKGAEAYEFEIHAYDGRILSFDQDR